MYGYGGRGITTISSGQSNGRCVYTSLMRGRITITGTDGDGRKFQRIVEVRDGEVWTNILKKDGKLVHHIAYGQFEKIVTPEGRELVSFKNTAHSKSIRRPLRSPIPSTNPSSSRKANMSSKSRKKPPARTGRRR